MRYLFGYECLNKSYYCFQKISRTGTAILIQEFNCLQSPWTNEVYITSAWRRQLLKREFKDNKYTKNGLYPIKMMICLFVLEIRPVNDHEYAYVKKSKCS